MKTLDKNKKELVEKIGVVYEKAGHTPMAGRIAGVLFLAEPPFMSFDELTDELYASKSAVSNALNLLMAMGLVDYKTFPGDRKRYFKINLKALDLILRKEIENINTLSTLLKKVRKARSNKYVEFNKEIDTFTNLLDIFYIEYPKIIERWENSNYSK